MTPDQKLARDLWKEDLRQAENRYRRALETYNDCIQEARKVYDAEIAIANSSYFGSEALTAGQRTEDK
jgi:hypothetical protein